MTDLEWHCRNAFFLLLALPYVIALCAGLRAAEDYRVWILSLIARTYFPLFYRLRANRRCPFPDGPALIIANHRSPADPIYIWCFHHYGPQGRRRIRRIEFFCAREYTTVPVVGWICRTMRVIPVSRDGRDMGPAREGLQRLRAGHWVGLFPEGRINPGYDLLPANEGVAWLALKAQVPVFPVFIHGAPQGTSMVQPFLTPADITVRFGEPIDVTPYAGRRPTHELLAEITDLLMGRLAVLGGVGYTPVLPHFERGEQKDAESSRPADFAGAPESRSAVAGTARPPEH